MNSSLHPAHVLASFSSDMTFVTDRRSVGTGASDGTCPSLSARVASDSLEAREVRGLLVGTGELRVLCWLMAYAHTQ